MLKPIASLFLTFAFAMTAAAERKVAKDLENLKPDSTVDVIVQYRKTPIAAHHQKIEARGGKHKTDLSLIKGGHYSVPVSLLAELEKDDEVVAISPDRQLRPMLDTTRATAGFTSAKAGGYMGTGIGVAVIDSGVYSPYLGNVVYTKNFTTATTTGDWYGHGTHVAGIIGNSGTANGGLAAGVKIISLKVLDDNGVGRDSWVIAAITEAIRVKATYNIRVINLSVGRPVAESYKTDPLCQAVEQAWKAGIVVVVAAGNEGRNNSKNTQGYATITSPGNDPYVITVGAMKTNGTTSRSDDTVASYSSKGPTLLDHVAKPDILAPGNKVVSTLYYNCDMVMLYPGNSVNDNYFRLSGTSMAAPVVSAAAALVLQKFPTLTPDQVKARLMRTATKTFPLSSTTTDPVTYVSYTSQYDVFTVGAGYLDVWAALNDTTPMTGTALALSPTVVLSPYNVISLVYGNNVVWGTNVVWGNNVVWGTNIVWGTNVVWGTSVVWGMGNTAGQNVVWGESIVWGSGTPAAEAASIAINGEN